jgi:hypothetical protein
MATSPTTGRAVRTAGRLQAPAGLPLLLGDTRQTAVAWVAFWQGVADQVSALGATLAAGASYANDAAAAAGGVSIGQLYRNGSVVQVRVA